MRPETEKIIAEVEQRSGLPVQLIPTRELRVIASVTLSPHATDSYVIQYRPGVAGKDYAVASQCCHILRTLAVPPNRRLQFASNAAGMSWGRKLIHLHLKRGKKSPVPDPVFDIFAEKLVGGLMTQLRSIPVGMRIDAWLSQEYPTLADEQAASFAFQQGEALMSLSPKVREFAPDEIIAGSILLNTAYALFCDRLLGETTYQVPYVAAGFRELGGALLGLFDEMPADPGSDVALVDRWAADIGLTGLYEWVPMPSSTAPGADIVRPPS